MPCSNWRAIRSARCRRPISPSASACRAITSPRCWARCRPPGLVRGGRGAAGGYRFTGNRRRITLMDIVALFEPAPGSRAEGAGRGHRHRRRAAARAARDRRDRRGDLASISLDRATGTMLKPIQRIDERHARRSRHERASDWLLRKLSLSMVFAFGALAALIDTSHDARSLVAAALPDVASVLGNGPGRISRQIWASRCSLLTTRWAWRVQPDCLGQRIDVRGCDVGIRFGADRADAQPARRSELDPAHWS